MRLDDLQVRIADVVRSRVSRFSRFGNQAAGCGAERPCPGKLISCSSLALRWIVGRELRPDSLGKESNSFAFEFVENCATSNHGESQRFAGATNFGARPDGPIDIGRNEFQSLGVMAGVCERIGVTQRVQQPGRINCPWAAQRATNVLMMHDQVREDDTGHCPADPAPINSGLQSADEFRRRQIFCFINEILVDTIK